MPYGTVNADLMTTSDGVSSSGLYGFKNRLINSAMVIDQRNAGASVTPATGDYTLDRWQYIGTQASKFTARQTPSATETGYATRVGAGFTNYLAMTVASAVSVGASDYFFNRQKIEGLNVSDLAWGTSSAKTVTLSFLAYSSLTGTFAGFLENSAGDRSYAFSYSIPVANTWTQISVTIAGDTSGTWLTTNGIGILVGFSLGAGSTYTGTAGSWGSTRLFNVTGAVSVVGTGSATFYITGVQLEKGSTATSFDYRPYGTELQLCQRYYQKITTGVNDKGMGVGFYYTSSTMIAQIPFQTYMRAAPTLDVNSGTNYFIFYTNNSNQQFNTVTLNDATPYTGAVTAGSLSGTSGSSGQFKTNNASTSLAFTAEL